MMLVVGRTWNSDGPCREVRFTVQERTVESTMRRATWGPSRFPSPLTKTGVPISGTGLSDWLHRKAHDGRPLIAGLGDNSSARDALRQAAELFLTVPDLVRCCQALRHHFQVTNFESALKLGTFALALWGNHGAIVARIEKVGSVHVNMRVGSVSDKKPTAQAASGASDGADAAPG
jgi:hypothetical protein